MEKKVNFSTRITEEQKAFLNEIAWIKGITVSDYVINLINEDMKNYPNWRESMDELNEKKQKVAEQLNTDKRNNIIDELKKNEDEFNKLYDRIMKG